MLTETNKLDGGVAADAGLTEAQVARLDDSTRNGRHVFGCNALAYGQPRSACTCGVTQQQHDIRALLADRTRLEAEVEQRKAWTASLCATFEADRTRLQTALVAAEGERDDYKALSINEGLRALEAEDRAGRLLVAYEQQQQQAVDAGERADAAEQQLAHEREVAARIENDYTTLLQAHEPMAERASAAEQQAVTLREALENVRLAAARGRSFGHQATPQTYAHMAQRKDEALDTVLRFCAKAGVEGSCLREDAPPPRQEGK